MRISSSISGDVTPLKLQASIRDHAFVLEGKIDDENIYYDASGNHTYISSSKVVDLPSESNGVYGDKFLLDYASASFYNDVWKKLVDIANATHIYREASGTVEVTGLETIKSGGGGAEKAARIKDGVITIKKPPQWKLLWQKAVANGGGVPTQMEYLIDSEPPCFPCICLSFRLGKKLTEGEEEKGITRIGRVLEETAESVTLSFQVSFKDIDKEDEFVYFSCEAFMTFEVLL